MSKKKYPSRLFLNINFFNKTATQTRSTCGELQFKVPARDSTQIIIGTDLTAGVIFIKIVCVRGDQYRYVNIQLRSLVKCEQVSVSHCDKI